LEALQRMEVDKAVSMKELVGGPMLTPNEGRERLGLEPIEGGDVLVVSMPGMPPAARSLTNFQRDELGKWRKKVENKGTDAPFNCQYLPDEMAGVIRSRLASGYQIDHAFQPPFVPF